MGRWAFLKDFEYETNRQEMFERAEEALEALGDTHPDGCQLGMLGCYCVLVDGAQDDGAVLVETSVEVDQKSLDSLLEAEALSVMAVGIRTSHDVVTALNGCDVWDEGEGGDAPRFDGVRHIFLIDDEDDASPATMVIVDDADFERA